MKFGTRIHGTKLQNGIVNQPVVMQVFIVTIRRESSKVETENYLNSPNGTWS